MGFIRPVAIAVALALSFLTAADAAGPLRPFKAGFWAGGAYTDDRTGAFTHCSAGVAYNSGINLFILVTGDYHWWLGFINPKWSLNPRDQVPVSLQFDAAPPLARLGTIPSPQLLLVPLPNALRIMLQPRQSPELGVSAEGRSFLFKLDDVQAVIDRLANCVRAARGQEPPVREATAAAAGRAGGSPIAGQPSPGGAPAASGSAAPASAALAAPVYSPDAPNPPSRSSGSDRANQNAASSPTGESAVTPDAVARGSSGPRLHRPAVGGRGRECARGISPGSPIRGQGGDARGATDPRRQAAAACRFYRRMAVAQRGGSGQDHSVRTQCQRARHRLEFDRGRSATLSRRLQRGAVPHRHRRSGGIQRRIVVL